MDEVNINKMPVVRDTNLELFRIFLMVVLIMPSHYIMSGGAIRMVDPEHLSLNMYVAELFSRTGRMGNNCFLLITGYFMCNMKFSWRKFWKLVFLVEFYAVGIYLLFTMTRYESFSFPTFTNFVLTIPKGVGTRFVGTFIALYMLVPFLNRLIATLSAKEFRRLLLLLVFFFSICNTFVADVFEMLAWYILVYLTGSYLRIYPPKILSTRKQVTAFLIVNLLLVFGSIVLLTYLSSIFNDLFRHIQISLEQSNHILSLTCSVSLFLWFKNLQIPHIRIVNKLATTILAVLCIHEHSATMHHFLYRNLFCVKQHFTDEWFPLYMFGCIAVLFLFCAIVELLRARFVEKPIFALLDKKYFNIIL